MPINRISSTIQFDPQASVAKRGIALLYDLEGFSTFFNQPDMQNYVPAFINQISNTISTIIFGGIDYWLKGKSMHPLVPPVHEKFLGDGCLYVWSLSEGLPPGKERFQILLCNRLWNLKNHFKEVLNRCIKEVPVVELPKRIRFGLASGTIYELTTAGSSGKEYIGFCINLASRLQKYCPELGFIASARLSVPDEELAKHGYIKVIATKLRGFPKEIVFVDKNEYESLSKGLRGDLFSDISAT